MTIDTSVKTVIQGYAESRGLSPGTPVSSHKEMPTGWSDTNPSIVASDMSHKVAAMRQPIVSLRLDRG
jgi:hypothetical protein